MEDADRSPPSRLFGSTVGVSAAGGTVAVSEIGRVSVFDARDSTVAVVRTGGLLTTSR